LKVAKRSWTGFRPSRLLPIPSTVVIAMPSIEATGRRHALTERRTAREPARSQLASMTVQAPQPPSPQLSFVPVRPLDRR
jgi:hypothetical protein